MTTEKREPEEDETYVEQCEDIIRDCFPCHMSNVKRLVAIIRKRFPKPAPVQRTPEELAESVRRGTDWLTDKQEADLDELVRLAKK